MSFDVALDCVARPETFEGAVTAVRRRGRSSWSASGPTTIPLPVSRVVVARDPDLRLLSAISHADFADVAGWVCRHEVDLAPIIERRVGFADVDRRL